MKEDGRTFNGFNRRTGVRNRCYRCDGEYHLAPKCPWRDVPRSELGSVAPEHGKARNPSYSAILTRARVSEKKADQFGSEETSSDCKQSLATTLDVGGLSSVPDVGW